MASEEDVSQALMELGGYARGLVGSKDYRFGHAFVSATQMIKEGKSRQLFAKVRNKLLHGWTNDDLRSPEWRSYVEGRLSNNSNRAPLDPEATITVYTCVTGGYDSIPPAFPCVLEGERVRFVAFVDDLSVELIGWERASIPDYLRKLSPQGQNRYIKLHPDEFCSSDFSVYVDGNLWLLDDPRWMCEIARDSNIGFAIFAHALRDTIAKEYQACLVLGKGSPEGLKRQYDRACDLGIENAQGLYEAPVLVSDLKNEKQMELYKYWWDEFSQNGFQRDQLALPCALKVCAFSCDDVGLLGSDVRVDPRILRREHQIA